MNLDITMRTLARETWIIAVIGLADLATTLYWVYNHGAQEANPIFARYLAMGPFYFALTKIVMLVAPLFVLEWARRHRPAFTKFALRFAIVAYLGMYSVGVYHANSDSVDEYLGAQDRINIASSPATNPYPYLKVPQAYIPVVYHGKTPGLRSKPVYARDDINY